MSEFGGPEVFAAAGVRTVDDLFKLADTTPKLHDRLYEYDPDNHRIGLGILLGRGDASIYGKDSAALKLAQQNRALQEAILGPANIDADQYQHVI